WKLISPSVVWAVKSGAVSPIVGTLGLLAFWFETAAAAAGGETIQNGLGLGLFPDGPKLGR
ncbi:MAG: hypothetical protein ACKOTA_11070, partial [Solirubrobacterales bacterium]